MKQLILSVAVLGISGCFSSTQPANEELDISMGKEPAQGVRDTKPKDEVQLKPDDVIDWQRFFRPSPNEKERNALSEQLANWKETESVASLIKKGRNQLVLGKTTAAETSFRRAQRLDDSNPDIILELAKLYLSSGKGCAIGVEEV